MGLFFLGVVGFIISLVLLIFRKKSRKLLGVLTVMFLIVGFVGILTPSVNPTAMVGDDPRPAAIQGDFAKINSGEWEGKFVKLEGEVGVITEKTDKIIVFDLVTDGGYYIVEGTALVGEIDFNIERDDKVVVYGSVEKPDEKTGIPIIGAAIVEK